MKKILIISAIVIFAVIFLNVVKDEPNQQISNETTVKLKDLGQLPTLSFEDFEGNTIKLADFAGTPLVINSWTTWCPFCIKELPDFVTAQENFGDAIKIIAIDRAESLKIAKEYTDNVKITDKILFLLDPSDSFYKAIGGFSMPETIFVDAEGIIRIHKRGPMELHEITEKINSLLNVN